MIDAALREDGRFRQLKMLGKGSFGCVCQARTLENEEVVAIKLMPRSEVRREAGSAGAELGALPEGSAAAVASKLSLPAHQPWALTENNLTGCR
jgi:serine/threonine protein kinase